MTVALCDTSLLNHDFDEVAAFQAFQQAHATSGAIASFAGRVRPYDAASGLKIDALYLDWYPGMSEQSLDRIAKDAMARFAPNGLLIIHRCGLVKAGEVIVLVCAASDHRRAALEAVDNVMDRLKSEAVLWKREIGCTADGQAIDRWVEPTNKDHLDLARWSKKEKSHG